MRHCPAPGLFRFVWHDEADDRPDDLDDDPPPVPPPLRARVRELHASAVTVPLWGTPVVVRKASGRSMA